MSVEHNVRVDCDRYENMFLACSCGWNDDTDATVTDITERSRAHIKDNDGRSFTESTEAPK